MVFGCIKVVAKCQDVTVSNLVHEPGFDRKNNGCECGSVATSRPLPIIYIHATSILERGSARVQNGRVSTRGTNMCKIVNFENLH